MNVVFGIVFTTIQITGDKMKEKKIIKIIEKWFETHKTITKGNYEFIKTIVDINNES